MEAAEKPSVILTVEEHTVLGGLGSAVAETLMEAGLCGGKRFKRLGIPDRFPDRYGSQADLFERYTLTGERLVSEILELLGLAL